MCANRATFTLESAYSAPEQVAKAIVAVKYEGEYASKYIEVSAALAEGLMALAGHLGEDSKLRGEDFELELEWKVAPKANSGIKYRFKNGLGPEYQVLDDKLHGNGKNPKTAAASMYALFMCNDQKELRE